MAQGWKYGEMMRALNPRTAERIGCGNGRETTRCRRVQLRFDWPNRDPSELGEGLHTASITRTRPNKARFAPGAAQ